MSQTVPERTPAIQTDLYSALSKRRRRLVLRIVRRVARIRPAELATRLIAEETNEPSIDVARPDVERALAELEHVHLPKLVETGLLARMDGFLTTTQHPALRDPKIDAIIRTESAGLDGVLDALAHRRRRIILAALYTTDGPMDRADLAAKVVATVGEEADHPVTVDDVLLDLHHVHLPKLEQTGLIGTGDEGETVTYEGHPALDEAWLIEEEQTTPRAIPSMAEP